MLILGVLLLLASSHAAPHTTCNCYYNTPVITTNRANSEKQSSVCAGCTYYNVFPAGNIELDLYYKYGQTISMDIYQNGLQIATCPRGTTCTKIIKLDPLYDVKTYIKRDTLQNTHATYGIHSMTFKPAPSASNTQPQINDESRPFNIPLFNKSTYTYNLAIGNDAHINMVFSDIVSISITDTQTQKVIYIDTGTVFNNIISSDSGEIQMKLTTFNNNVSASLFYLLPINDRDDATWENLMDVDDDINHIYDVLYAHAILIFVLLGAVALLWLLLVIHWFCICCCC
mgnify:CR=1 FL=1